MAELVAYVNGQRLGVRADEVAAALHLSKDDAGRYLRRAFDSGRVERPKPGLYTPVRSVRSVRFEFDGPDTSDTPDTLRGPVRVDVRVLRELAGKPRGELGKWTPTEESAATHNPRLPRSDRPGVSLDVSNLREFGLAP